MSIKCLLAGFMVISIVSLSPNVADAQTTREDAIKAGATPLTSDEIAELLVGKTVTARLGEKEFLFHYSDDNVLSGKLIGGGWSDTGYYGITDDDRVCVSMTKDKGRLRCMTLLETDGLIKKYNVAGKPTFELIAFQEGSAFAAKESTVRDAIENTLAKFEAAFNKRNAAGVASFYTEDATLLPPGERRVVGREAIQAYWQGAIDAGLKDLSLNAVEIRSEQDLAYEVGRFSLTAPGESDQVVSAKGKYIAVWQRDGGQWRLHRDIWNMDPPSPTE